MGFVIITHFEAFIDIFILKQIKNFWGQPDPILASNLSKMFNMAIVVQFGKKNQPSVSMGLAQEMEKKREREREETGRGVKYIIIKKRPERHRGWTFRERERESYTLV